MNSETYGASVNVTASGVADAQRAVEGTKLRNVFLEFFNDYRWHYYTVVLSSGGHMRSELSVYVSVIGIPEAGNDS